MTAQDVVAAVAYICDGPSCGVRVIHETTEAFSALPDGWSRIGLGPVASTYARFCSDECANRWVDQLRTERRSGNGWEIR